MVAKQRRRAGVAHGAAQGPPRQEDVPRAGRRARCRRRSAGSRRRSAATRSTARGWRSSPTAAPPRPATACASGSPAGRCSSWTCHGPDPPDPRPPRRDRPPRRRATRSTGPARRAAGPDGLERLFLHAWRLELVSPSTGAADPRRGAAAARARVVLERPARGRRRAAGRRAGERVPDRRRADPEIRARRAGCAARDHLGPVGRGQGHDHRRPAAPRDPSSGGDYHYVVTCTTRAARPGEITDVSLPLRLDRPVPRSCTTPASCSRRTRSTATGTGRPRREVARALAEGRDVILKIDVQGARVVKERVPRRDPDLHRPAVARGAVPAPPQPGDRDGRRARAPPAQRRDRARPPGRLRPRGRRTRTARWSGPPRRSRRSSPRRSAATRTGGSASADRPVTDTSASRPATSPPATVRPPARDVRRAARAPCSSRSRSTPRPAAGRAPSPTACRRRSATSRPARPCWCEFGKGGRQALGVVLGTAGRPGRRRAEAVAARVRSRRAAPAAARACASRAWIADRYLAPLAVVHPGDAPAGHARAPGARSAEVDAGRRGGARR